jgi:transposase
MLRIDVARWNQTIEDLRDAACRAEHARTRERFLALYEIARGSNATQVAVLTGRCDESVMAWVHAYNENGPDALTYRRTGGHPPFARASKPRSTPPSAPRSRSRPRRP